MEKEGTKISPVGVVECLGLTAVRNSPDASNSAFPGMTRRRMIKSEDLGSWLS